MFKWKKMQSVSDLQSVVKLTISHHSSIYEIVFLNYWYVLIPLIQVDISMIVLKSFSRFWTQNTRPSEWSWQDTIYLFWLGDIFHLSRMVQFHGIFSVVLAFVRSVAIKENAHVLALTATDPDEGEDGEVDLSIVEGNAFVISLFYSCHQIKCNKEEWNIPNDFINLRWSLLFFIFFTEHVPH